MTSQVVVQDSHPGLPYSRDSEHHCWAVEGPWVLGGRCGVFLLSCQASLRLSLLTGENQATGRNGSLPISYGQGLVSARGHPHLPDYVRGAWGIGVGLEAFQGFSFGPVLTTSQVYTIRL